MADKFTRFLSGIGQGITNPKGNLGDARHASRVFTDGAMARAPRTKFLFHVFFELNPNAVRSTQFKTNHNKEIGLLVKGTTLPRIGFETDVKNQYNRKKIVYKNLNFDPIQIKFHDDNLSIINSLWQLYFSYYSPEPLRAAGEGGTIPAYENTNATSGPYNKGELNYRYGLDREGKTTDEFFKSITIYTLAKRRFNSYKLINPYIRNWDHGDVSYAESSGTVEATMDIGYETVIYGSGAISRSDQAHPKAFGELHYDQVPSPLSILGGQTSSLFGPGGFLSDGQYLAGAETIYGTNYQRGTTEVNALQAAVGAINLYQSFQNINSGTIAQEVLNLSLTPNRAVNTVSGLSGVQIGKQGN